MLLALKDKLNRIGMLKKMSAGGSASNTCNCLSLAGYKVGLTGVLGEDTEGENYLKELTSEDTGGIVRKEKTGTAYIINAGNKDRAIIVFPNSNSSLKASEIDYNFLSQAKWIHMTSFITEEAMEIQKGIKTRLGGKTLFSIDPGEIYARMGGGLYPLIDGMEILFISEKELELLFCEGVEMAIKKALDMVKMVVVKKGKRGACVYAGGGRYDAVAEPVKVIDNTGAGDCLNGVFLGLYLRGIEPALAIRVATKAASLSTQGYGRDSYPSGHKIEELLRNEKG
jgi:ribokinase